MLHGSLLNVKEMLFTLDAHEKTSLRYQTSPELSGGALALVRSRTNGSLTYKLALSGSLTYKWVARIQMGR